MSDPMSDTQVLPPKSPSQNETLFKLACDTPSDTYLHLPKLREIAGQCGHVTEFGNWTGTSLCALLMGLLDSPEARRKLVAVDINPDYQAAARKRVETFWSEGVEVEYRVGSTLEVDIEETDFLFIDSWHCYGQLRDELARHSARVRRYIFGHDWAAFGFTGEDLKSPGLVAAVEEFLADHPEWEMCYETDVNNGLFGLRRVQ